MGVDVDDELGREGESEDDVECVVERGEAGHGNVRGRLAILRVEDADDEVLQAQSFRDRDMLVIEERRIAKL